MQWISDFRHAWRALLRTPGFLVTSVGTLALAIGAVAGMFSVVNTVLLQPLPFPDSDRLVVIAGTAPGSDLPERFGLGQEFYLHYKERSKLLDGIFLFGAGTSTLRTENRVERIPMAWPTNDMYATLGVRPQLGRLPVPEDGDRVVVISDQLWSTWFGRDPAVVGKSYFVSGEMRQVIGVMPPEFSFPSDETMLWVAGEIRPAEVRPGQLGAPVVARMKPGVTREQLAAELTRLSKELPGALRRAAQLRAAHRAAPRGRGADARPPRRSDGQHVAVGAARRGGGRAAHRVRQRRQPVPGARRGTPPRPGRAPRDRRVARAARPAPDGRGVPGRAAGRRARRGPQRGDAAALPARRARGHSAARPREARPADAGCRVRAGGRRGAGLRRGAGAARVVARSRSPARGARGSTGRRHWGRDVLVVGQTALALVLLIGSALLVQSFQRLRNVDPGYDTDDIYTFQFAPEQERLTDGPAWGRFHLDFMDRLRALPGVTGVGVVNNIPLDEGTGTGAVPHRRDGPGRRRRAARSELHRRRLLPRDGDRRCCGGARSQPTKRSRRTAASSSAGRRPSGSGPTGSARAADPSHRRHAAVVHRRRRGGGREAGRLARGRRGGRVLPADRTDADHVGDGIAGVRRQVAARREPWRARCASWCGRWRPKRRCIASSRWSSWRSGRWCSCRSRC